MSKALQTLRSVFAPLTQESSLATGSVMNAPSGVTRDIALQTIEALNLAPILTNIGIGAAKEICDELERMGLRPADYADLPDMPELVAARIGAELVKAPTDFVAALIEQMRLRG